MAIMLQSEWDELHQSQQQEETTNEQKTEVVENEQPAEQPKKRGRKAK